MGQQQLILLVLATVIVGIAIVVGISAFTENSNRSNADALMQDAVRIGNDIQAWGQKPVQFGGPDVNATTPEDFTDANFTVMGYQADDDAGLEYTNLNGTFTITGGENDLLITGEKLDDDGSTTLNAVEVCVTGTNSDDDIVGAVTTIGGETTGDGTGCGAGSST